MNNDLSTKIVRLDLDFILDNCFKPALWDKEWTIFKYDGYRITIGISNIDVRRKQVSCAIKLYKEGEHHDWAAQSDSYEINFQKEHRNLEVIQKGLNGRIFRWLLEWEERHLIQETVAYQEAEAFQEKLESRAKEMAEAYLDEKGIEDDEIREAYIERMIDNANTSKYTDEVYEAYKGSKLPKLFLSYALFAEDEEAYAKYKKLARANGFKIGHLRSEIKAEFAKIEAGEMNTEEDE